ncbi:MAG: archaeosortase/exosortase family protein, partial [Candidatus Methylumidiphilus sp.]
MNSETPFLKSWWPVLTGLLVLYLPTYYDLSQTVWTEEEYVHSPMVLIASIWLFWRQREALLAPPQQTRPAAGGILLGVGLLLYAIGRSQEILLFEVGSQIPVLLGVLLITLGDNAVRKLWF